jgi:hypothetical protein
MIFLDTTFFFSHGDREWKIPLPGCPHCEGTIDSTRKENYSGKSGH